MAESRQFEALRQQFDAVARNLRQCTHPKERRELLRRMRLVINEADKLILNEPSHADSKAKQHSPVAHVFPIPPLGPEVSHPVKRQTEETPAHKPGRLCRGRSVPSFSGRSGHSSVQNDPLSRMPSLQSSCSLATRVRNSWNLSPVIKSFRIFPAFSSVPG
jgi:hypothetical protein